ncbi:secretoglobin family 1D member isoform X1 [Bos indicus x Bos taurus]|uniref:Secretoglobin family 1D member n=1 Tax=Bos indicus x Bos taurus TaxID=30522 RepID=A0A4W2FHV8_BOBOX|nr:PREDICTED: secretoglobin family 1D member isoform X1 [Bos indicus]XP_027388376.1 secretoglobin family 1D member isoform X1 [Bos indicus x Bos taurus]
MRLSVTALLVTLALCYYEANAIVCPTFAVDLTEFFYFPDLLYRLSLAKYNAPPEAVAAKMEVKQCTDRFSVKNRLIITNVLGKILLNCTVTDVKAVLNPSSA